MAGLGVLHFLLSLRVAPAGLLQKYPAFAELAVAGQLSGEAAAPASPLYLLIHVAFSDGFVRWAQCGAALGSLVLVYLIARRLSDPLTGLLSAGLFSLSAVVLVYGGTLEPDIFLMAACLLGVWAAPRVQAEWKYAALFGAAMGLAISLRPTAGLIGLGILAGLTLQAGLSRTFRRSRRQLSLAAATLLAFGLAPMVGVRGLVSAPARGTMSPGSAFYDGNRPESLGIGVTNPWLVKAMERQIGPGSPFPDAAHALYRQFARLDGGGEMTLGETQRYWAGKSWEFARLEPGAFAALTVRKLLFFLSGTEYHDIHLVRRSILSLRPLPLLRYSWIALLALAGILLAAWRRRMSWWLWAYWAAGVAGLLIFSVTTRYAMVFFPALALFAGSFTREALATRNWKKALGLAACLVAGVLPSLSPGVRWDRRVQERVTQAHAQVETILASRGDLSRTVPAFVMGQSYYPFLPSIMDPRGLPFESPELALQAARGSQVLGGASPADWYLQAVLWQKAGDCGQALPLALRAAEKGFHTTDNSRLLDPHLLRAQCLADEGREAEAMDAVLASLEDHPATADGLAMAIAGSEATGLRETEVGDWEETLARIHDPLSGALALTRSYRMWGKTEAALEVAGQLQEWLPESSAVAYETALLHAAAEEAAPAFEALQRARTLDPRLPLELAPFGEVLDQLLLSEPQNRDVWIAKIDQAAQAGRFREAADVAGQGILQFPDDREILGLQRVMEGLAVLVEG